MNAIPVHIHVIVMLSVRILLLLLLVNVLIAIMEMDYIALKKKNAKTHVGLTATISGTRTMPVFIEKYANFDTHTRNWKICFP